ncbi:TlpA family protein disulfide reductase [Brevibacillus daliensis]|uniref:TlpA family protein disulfide reductase n=1 Tax=Brevibacillus daliensis TaxID=2892995 RepID=UPI001E455E9E|nr:TlpA disulfide reductase family protein [Brevibacillus daliensis]
MKKFGTVIISMVVLFFLTQTINQQIKDNNLPTETGNSTKSGNPAAKEEKQELPRIGFLAPSFELKGLDGKSYRLSDQQKASKPVLVNFWASWCEPCHLEAPMLTDLYAKYKDKAEFYAVNLTKSDSVDLAYEFVDQYKFEFPVLLDESASVKKKYYAYSIPTTYFINKDGVIIDVAIGVLPPDVFEDKILRMINE